MVSCAPAWQKSLVRREHDTFRHPRHKRMQLSFLVLAAAADILWTPQLLQSHTTWRLLFLDVRIC